MTDQGHPRVAFFIAMKNSRGIIDRVLAWVRKEGHTKALTAPLSDKIRELFAGGNALALKATVKAVVRKEGGGSAQDVRQLQEHARATGWSEEEIKKIGIYADYFSDNVGAAYDSIIRGELIESDFDMYVLACIALYLNDSFEDAYVMLKRRHLSDPGFDTNHDFLSFAGYIVLASGRPIEEALEYLDYAYVKGLNSVAFVTNGYPIYFEAGRLEEAARLREIIHEKFGETDPEVNWSVSTVELAREYYPEGFRLAESRYRHPEAAIYINKKLLDKPRWNGEDLRDKTLLVHAEQGLGDTIMCARFLSKLSERAGRVILECQEEARTLLEQSYPTIEIVSTQKDLAAELDFDCWVATMSLPYWFNVTRDTVPGTGGYLRSPHEHVAYWKDKLGKLTEAGRLRVGIAWAGNPRHRADRRRSIQFDVIKPYLAGMSEVLFFPLQTSVPNDLPVNVINVSEELVTLADTAALAEEMDVVISVDTAIVHIAGALGLKTWLLFPYRYDWRWGLEGESNSWYDSVRVIRQSRHGDWQSVLDEVFHHRLPALKI